MSAVITEIITEALERYWDVCTDPAWMVLFLDKIDGWSDRDRRNFLIEHAIAAVPADSPLQSALTVARHGSPEELAAERAKIADIVPPCGSCPELKVLWCLNKDPRAATYFAAREVLDEHELAKLAATIAMREGAQALPSPDNAEAADYYQMADRLSAGSDSAALTLCDWLRALRGTSS
jgi:hypothetical protein